MQIVGYININKKWILMSCLKFDNTRMRQTFRVETTFT